MKIPENQSRQIPGVSTLLLMPGVEETMNSLLDQRETRRWSLPWSACLYLMGDMAKRIVASREQFPWQFYRGDCHSHSQHSDGIGTVEEIAIMVKEAGLDFQFVTDHWGVTQAPECREHGLWYGQEPGTEHHHLGILGLDYAFVPKANFLEDYAYAVAQGATVFIPHPTGWWPSVVYTKEQTDLLEHLPSPFLMEICNGANNIVSAFDYTDDAAIQLWDHLLCLGKRVHAMGNTDAHLPHSIGMVWNCVFAAHCDQTTILAELRQGHSFVSDGPLIHIALGEARMGDQAISTDLDHQLEITVVDSRGLNSVSVIVDGKETFYEHIRRETSWSRKLKLPVGTAKYVRAEVHCRDGRRAYSNPIYLTRQNADVLDINILI